MSPPWIICVNMCCKGEVNGKFVSNIQIDTGACRTVVREDLVSRQTWKDSMVKLRIVDNTEVKYPVADVIIKTGNNTYQIEAAIVRQLPADVLLGRDMLLVKSVPLPEYTMNTWTLMKSNRPYRGCCRKEYFINYSGGFREVCISCRDESSKDQEVRGRGSNEEPGE